MSLLNDYYFCWNCQNKIRKRKQTEEDEHLCDNCLGITNKTLIIKQYNKVENENEKDNDS